MAGHIVVAGYYGMVELTDTSAAEEDPALQEAGRLEARLSPPHAKNPRPQSRKNAMTCKGIDMFATIRAHKALFDIGEILRSG